MLQILIYNSAVTFLQFLHEDKECGKNIWRLRFLSEDLSLNRNIASYMLG